MTTITPLAQLASLPDGAPVLATEAVVEKINKVFTKGAPGSPDYYHLQTIVLRDGAATINATLSQLDPAPNEWVGARMRFSCSRTAHGFKGVAMKLRKAKSDKYKDELVLWITPSAEITPAVGSGGGDTAPEQVATGHTHIRPAAPIRSELDVHEDVKDIQEGLQQKANLMVMCLRKVRFLDDAYGQLFGEHMTPEQRQRFAISMFISGERCGMVEKMPTGDVRKYLPEIPPCQPKA
jgi:hypothetical protein